MSATAQEQLELVGLLSTAFPATTPATDGGTGMVLSVSRKIRLATGRPFDEWSRAGEAKRVCEE